MGMIEIDTFLLLAGLAGLGLLVHVALRSTQARIDALSEAMESLNRRGTECSEHLDSIHQMLARELEERAKPSRREDSDKAKP